MTWIDYAFITTIIISCLISTSRGFFLEVLSLINWCCAFFFTNRYYRHIAVYLKYFENKLIREGIAGTVLFITILIIGNIFNCTTSKLIKKTCLSEIDKVLGFCFGILRGILVVILAWLFLENFTGLPKSEDWQKSYLISQFSFIFKLLYDYL